MSFQTNPIRSVGTDVQINSSAAPGGSPVKEATADLILAPEARVKSPDPRVQIVFKEVQNEVQEEQPQIQLELKRKPLTGRVHPGPVHLFNDLGTSSATVRVRRSEQEKIEKAYQNLKELVAPDEDLVNFNISKMRVDVFGRDDNGKAYIKDVLDLKQFIKDPEIKEAYEVLEEEFSNIWGAPLHNQSIKSGSKSSSSKPPMQRTNEVFQHLPKKDDFSSCASLAMELYSSRVNHDPAKQEMALKKITAVEKIVADQVKFIQDRITLEMNNLSAAATDSDKKAIEEKIKKLNDLKRKWDIDRLGLYLAVAFTPHPVNSNLSQALEDAKEAAENAREVLQQHIDEVRDTLIHQDINKKLPSWFPDSIRGTERNVPENKEYSVDAAALIFSSLPIPLARGAVDFWSKHMSAQKMEGLEDALIRCVLAHEDQDIPPQQLTRGLDSQLAAEMTQSFKTSKDDAKNILNGSQFPRTPFPATADINAKINHLKTEYLT